MNTSEMSDGVKIAIAIIIICILIAIVFGIIRFVKAQTDEGTTNLEETVLAVGETEMDQYDNTVRSGSQVMSYIQLNMNRDVAVTVHTRKNPAGVNYGRLLKGTVPGTPTAILSGFVPNYDTAETNGVIWNAGSSTAPEAPAGPGGTAQPGNAGPLSIVPGVPTAYVAGGFDDNIKHNVNLIATRKSGHVDYIRPTAKFNSYLIRDIGDQVVGVVFIQQTTVTVPSNK